MGDVTKQSNSGNPFSMGDGLNPRVIIHPQYKQDNEVGGFDKANYNQSPLQIYSSAGQDDTYWRGLYVNINTTPNTTGTAHTLYIPFAVKYTIEFTGRRWLPALPTDHYRLESHHVLGIDKLGSGPHLGEGAVKPYYDGAHGCKHTSEPESLMSEQRRTTQTLDSKDEQTDSEEPISTSYTSNMLGGSRNKYWKGHLKRCNMEIHPLHQTAVN